MKAAGLQRAEPPSSANPYSSHLPVALQQGPREEQATSLQHLAQAQPGAVLGIPAAVWPQPGQRQL